MNFDILQLNDMIVPELLDIAKKLDVKDANGTDKQALIYKILDAQAIMPLAKTKKSASPKPIKDEVVEAKPVKVKKAAPKKAATAAETKTAAQPVEHEETKIETAKPNKPQAEAKTTKEPATEKGVKVKKSVPKKEPITPKTVVE